METHARCGTEQHPPTEEHLASRQMRLEDDVQLDAEVHHMGPYLRCALGGGSLPVADVGLGTWAWGSPKWGWGQPGAQYNERTVEGAWAAAASGGSTLVDTAESYGNGVSESLCGRFLASGARSQTQNRPLIATKGWAGSHAPRNAVQAARASCARLGVQKVDLYQAHTPAPDLELQADALAAVVVAGLADCIGICNVEKEEQLLRVVRRLETHHGMRLASCQVQLSLLHQKHALGPLLTRCRELDILLIAYSPLASGRLTGKYSAETMPKGRGFGNCPTEKLNPLLRELRKLAKECDRSPAQVALRWAADLGNVLPIPGAKTAAQARDNMGTVGWALTPEQWQRLTFAGNTASQR